jgi:hypothetical protein
LKHPERRDSFAGVNARKLLAFAFFLFLAQDGDTAYSNHYFAPMGLIGDLFSMKIPWKIGIDNHIVIAILLLGRSSSRAEWVRPMVTAMKFAAATLVIELLWGMINGGTFQPAYWQIYHIWSGLLFGYCVAAVCANARDFEPLLDAIVYAAGYRAVMCILYWNLYVHSGEWKTEFILNHDDSVLQASAVFVVVVRLLYGSPHRFRSFAFLLLQVGSMIFNNRRLVWLSVAFAAVFLIYLLPPSKAKKRLVRTAMVLGPVLWLYVQIGSGRSEPIFKPVASFSSTAGKEDASTKARNVENLGLVATGNASNRVIGGGWGRPYIEVANWYTIAAYFPLWQYIPHNSILGILAFTGIFGFGGLWLPFPTAMFLNSRIARTGNTAYARQLGTLGALFPVIVGFQMYGDMGSYYVRPMMMLGFSYAIALRLPAEVGAWPSRRAKLEPAKRRERVAPEGATAAGEAAIG